MLVKKTEVQSAVLKRHVIVNQDENGNPIAEEINRNEIKNLITEYIKDNKNYQISVYIDGMWRSGKSFNRATFQNGFNENKHIFSNTEWYTSNYEPDNNIYAIRVYEFN